MAKLLSYIKGLFRRGRGEKDLAEELQFHLQNEIEKNIKGSMTSEEARYAARLFLAPSFSPSWAFAQSSRRKSTGQEGLMRS
jgi:hypothetical protein